MISVIIPSFNSFKTIEYTLNSLLSQDNVNLLSEIIVVDSSDDWKTKQILDKYQSKKITVVNEQIKTIPALARNIGAKYAKSDILAFIDSDAFAAPDWLEKIDAAYKGGIKIGGGSISMAEFQRYKIIPLAQYFLQFNEFMGNKKDKHKSFVPSVNMFCERKLFNEAGGFPNIRTSEDVLFGLKVNTFSEVWFISAIKVFHIFREDIKGFLKNQMLLGKYIMVYRRIHEKEAFYYKGLWPLLLLPCFLTIKLFRITLRILRNNLVYILKYFFVLPVFLIGLFFWGIGFINGIFSYDK